VRGGRAVAEPGDNHMTKRTRRIAAALLPLTLLAAACGSDDSEDAGGDTTAADSGTDTTAAEAEGGGDGLAAAQAAVADVGAPPDAIGPTVPIEGEIPPKTVAWLECEQPSCQPIRAGFEAATELLGWELLVIPSTSFDQGPSIQQALDQGADYLAHTGSPLATAEEQIAAAQAAGVPYLSCYATDDPDFENNNLLMQCGDDDGVAFNGGLVANWVIADSGGAANVLIVNIPDFPVLVSEVEGAKGQYEANCPDCTVQELNTTVDSLIAGEVAGAVASQLQSNPDINYIQFTFGDLPAGVADTLEESGLLEGRKIVGVDFSTQIGLPEIISGRHQAWTANPKPYAGWLMVDAMVRHAVGQDNAQERDNAKLPTFIVSTADDAQAILDLGDVGWPGPDTMAEQFAELWGV
jgi:ribose transport system substrate-binding protein